MRHPTSSRHAHIAAIALTLAVAAGASLPAPAHAATRVPGTCELVNNTACNAPGSLLEWLRAWLA